MKGRDQYDDLGDYSSGGEHESKGSPKVSIVAAEPYEVHNRV